jgi:hypothetical protein
VDTVACNWSVTGTLHAITNGANTSRIYYYTDSVLGPESGFIVASFIFSNNVTLSDSIYVHIITPHIKLILATTGDWNGNGYLDHITLHFSKPLSLSANYSFQNLHVTYGTVSFPIDSIMNNTTPRVDTVWVLALKEAQDQKMPQTAWRPRISMSAQDSINLDTANIVASDGAGPVIWSVIRQTEPIISTTRDDIITVTLSEPITCYGNSISVGMPPSTLFSVWKDDTGVFTMADNMLSGVNNLESITRDSTVQFIVSNGNDFASDYYFALDSTVMDEFGNRPNLNNQKVPVITTGTAVTSIVLAGYNNINNYGFIITLPQIVTPTTVREPPGEFNAVDNPNAKSWVKQDSAGAVIELTMVMPDSTMSLHVGITNENGDEVQGATNADFIESIKQPIAIPAGSIVHIDLYWNGYGKNGKALDGGKYTVTADLDYTDPSIQDQAVQTDFEIPGGSAAKHCGCGSGTGLAFIPPIGFKISAWRKRKTKNKKMI